MGTATVLSFNVGVKITNRRVTLLNHSHSDSRLGRLQQGGGPGGFCLAIQSRCRSHFQHLKMRPHSRAGVVSVRRGISLRPLDDVDHVSVDLCSGFDCSESEPVSCLCLLSEAPPHPKMATTPKPVKRMMIFFSPSEDGFSGLNHGTQLLTAVETGGAGRSFGG